MQSNPESYTVPSSNNVTDRRLQSSCCCFGAAVILVLLIYYSYLSLNYVGYLIVFCLLVAANGPSLWLYSLQSSLLGCITTYCCLSAYYTADHVLRSFFCYLACLSLFHYLEFFFTALTSIDTLDHSSFLLDHSVMYWVAAVCSWIEFFLEYHFCPQLHSTTISVIGLIMVIIGEVFRKLAMVHAGNGFTHRIIRYKRPKHVLVTNGVYSIVRHPGYTGWFIWCIGTQVLLCNPVCVVVYALSAWFFFKDRIYEEERLLLQFFGRQYRTYQQRVPLGVPFLRGYHL